MKHGSEDNSNKRSQSGSGSKEPSKIVVIGGFLGSGKTTLLKRFLEWEFSKGTRPFVIMSEFGDFDVDGTVITDERLELTAIVGGCICCGNRDELTNSLKEITGNTLGSHIYIETTGVADPAGVLEAISPVIQTGTAVIKKVIVVYDASNHQNHDRDAKLIEKQLMTTDWIIINKCDLVPDKVKTIATDLSSINPSARILETVNCVIEPEEATKGLTGCFAAGAEVEVMEGEFQSFAFKLETRLLRNAFEEWLASLPPDVIRVKGFVRFEGQSGIFEVQATKGQYCITPFRTTRWLDSTLVAITRPIPADKLVKGLKACVADTDNS